MIKIRQDLEANYKAIFFDGKTIRLRLDNDKPIKAPKHAEIEDVAINSKCFANCFIGKTPILLYNNKHVNIEDIKIGDKVISYDENEDKFKTEEVYELFSNDYEGELFVIELENGEILKCTPEHPFLTQRGWIEAKNLTDMDDIKSL